MTNQQIAKKISRITGSSTHKLNTFELLFAAAEYEKYDLTDLAEQAKSITLTDEERVQLENRFNEFETPWKSQGSWSKSGPMYK